MGFERVFGLGLSRTGTTSLHAAAIILGFSAIHYPIQISRKWMSGDFSANAMGPFTFFTDVPVATYFRDFDRAFENSKFILTVRDTEYWIVSVDRLFNHTIPSFKSTAKETNLRDLNHLVTYGMVKFHRQHFLDVYRRHADQVVEYFHDRPNDLLILDAAKEHNPWIPLCQFLGVPLPERDYPHFRKASLGGCQYVLPDEIDAKQRLLYQMEAQLT